MSVDELAQRVLRLLDEAAQVFRGHDRAETWLRHHRERLAEPLRLAVAGPPQSGKSTLVNALIGEEVAPVLVDGAPGAPVWFHDGAQPLAQIFPGDAPPYAAPLERAAGTTRPGHVVAGPAGASLAAGHIAAAHAAGQIGAGQIGAGQIGAGQIGAGQIGAGQDAGQVGWGGAGDTRVVVEWPCRALRHTRLLDAPGIDPDDETPAAERALAEADAVLYLTRHLGDDDLAPLQRARSARGVGASPVHVMVVLSRADETAGGRADALLGARRIARRRRRDPRVAALCQDVLAVSGKMAAVGRSLREEEYATVAAIADLPRAEADAHLLSTDRFTGAAFPVDVPAQRRAALLGRLGLGGVRLATTLVRTGARSRAALGAQLVRRSGLSELQASVSDLFTARREVLKARTALIAIDQLLRTESRPQAAYLVAELDRLVAGAHEFRELRLLAALRTGRVALPAELAVEARRLAGGEGGAHAERLGVAADTPPEELWPAAADAAERWHGQTGTATTAGGRRAAEVVLRSCTAILDDLG